MPSAILVKEIDIPNCKISLAVFVLYPQAGRSEIRGRFPNGVQVRHLRKTSPSPPLPPPLSPVSDTKHHRSQIPLHGWALYINQKRVATEWLITQSIS